MSGREQDALDARAWQALSLLLGYPDQALYAHLPLLARVCATLPRPVAGPMRRFLDFAGEQGQARLAQQYVATFDHKRRGCLYLTYYTHGDTRKRGVALLRLKQRYAAAGLRLSEEELPDHLCVVLEFAAANPAQGRAVLAEYRAGVALLGLALADAGSPWRDLLDALAATLPALTGDERQAAARLAAQGPPEEQVGLEPFAPPEFMPETVGGRR